MPAAWVAAIAAGVSAIATGVTGGVGASQKASAQREAKRMAEKSYREQMIEQRAQRIRDREQRYLEHKRWLESKRLSENAQKQVMDMREKELRLERFDKQSSQFSALLNSNEAMKSRILQTLRIRSGRR